MEWMVRGHRRRPEGPDDEEMAPGSRSEMLDEVEGGPIGPLKPVQGHDERVFRPREDVHEDAKCEKEPILGFDGRKFGKGRERTDNVSQLWDYLRQDTHVSAQLCHQTIAPAFKDTRGEPQTQSHQRPACGDHGGIRGPGSDPVELAPNQGTPNALDRLPKSLEDLGFPDARRPLHQDHLRPATANPEQSLRQLADLFFTAEDPIRKLEGAMRRVRCLTEVRARSGPSQPSFESLQIG